ncbi:hypothetical protein KSF_112780 [Reticulibacter mediterranei]|uniref:Uncharacterized protein n=2 Tax=Reticulibacter mediterranei TaxID=2778369 RepID=A0A8J3NA30_9CHLR|nr:hypothetical protein KSF_074530 [Reticulibacter mediterranei]GHP01231.1 hypothetical protein KSF_112780 [Reticulibacter mediterranei]
MADGCRPAVHNRHMGIIADHFVAQPAPHALFDGPQIGGLPHKGRAMQVLQCWGKVGVVTLKVVKEGFVLRQAQVTAYDLHRDRLTFRELGSRASCS